MIQGLQEISKFQLRKDSRHQIEEDILRAETLLEAARLAFCPLCLRPLQQFPDEAPAAFFLRSSRYNKI